MGHSDESFPVSFSFFFIATVGIQLDDRIVSLRKNIGFIVLFGLLATAFFLLGANAFTGSAGFVFSLPFSTSVLIFARAGKAGGAVGIATALVAYYIGLSELLAAEQVPIFYLPIGVFRYD